jgi:N-acetylglutamate synthase-like GNAT family acetyltransferase
MKIRKAQISDLEAITNLFKDTVLNINIKDYSKEQVATWSAVHADTPKWLKRLDEQHFWVAEKEGNIIGITSLSQEGYLDLMYVHHLYQNQGVAKNLLLTLLAKAKQMNLGKITSDVSITAKPFFEKYGFVSLLEQRKLLAGIEFVNYKMEILL